MESLNSIKIIITKGKLSVCSWEASLLLLLLIIKQYSDPSLLVEEYILREDLIITILDKLLPTLWKILLKLVLIKILLLSVFLKPLSG